VRTCSLCQAQSPDSAQHCESCDADLATHSATAVALAALQASPRVLRIRLLVADDACPACQAAAGEFEKTDVPALPIPGCSHARGCRCTYSPALQDIYP
jgi:hypothetical protein